MIAIALALLAAGSAELTVDAAASLREAFTSIGRAFESATPGVRVSFQFAGSQELRTQIENGQAADVVATADLRHMDALAAKKLVERPAIFARNELVIAVPQGNPAQIHSVADLARRGRVVLGVPEVPIGRYSEQVLGKAGVRDDVLKRVISRELNVRQVVAKVALGEADAVLVYRTDVSAAVEAVPIPPDLNVVAEYPIAELAAAPHRELARAFVAYVLSPAGQATLAAAGFLPP
jgi:molybdate transport system substrate-binding protein